jgi:replicative DNA helicase
VIEFLLLSKILDEKDFYILNKYNVNEDDFTTNKEIYSFIKKYVEENDQTPDTRTVGMKFNDFEYVPDVIDSFKYLCTELKNISVKRKMFELLQSEASQKFSEMGGVDFTKWLKEKVESLEQSSRSSITLGTDFSKSGEERKEMYLNKKENKEKIFVPTPYPTLTRCLNGGWLLGDYVLFQAFVNSGKSWCASHIGITAYLAKFNILHYSIELPRDQQLERLDTLLGHFNNSELSRGELTNEEEFFSYLDKFNVKNETSYIVKSMNDLPSGLSLEQIKEDINLYPNTNVIIIDSFNLMKHRGGIKNMRNSLSQTSRDLRQFFVKENILGIMIHQSSAAGEKERKKKDDVQEVIITPPSILDFSETSAVIQDSSCILSFAQRDGIGRISVEKSRSKNGKGTQIDLHCNFNEGFITEVQESDYF